MALLCCVVAAPSSSCVEAARWFLAIRWFLGIEEPLNETETERELQTEKRREHLQSWAGLPQLGGEDNGQGWNRKGGDVCSVHLLGSRVTNICLCGLPLNELRRGGGDLAVLVQMACQVCWCCWLTRECVHLDWPEQHPTACKVLRQLQVPTPENQKGILLQTSCRVLPLN